MTNKEANMEIVRLLVNRINLSPELGFAEVLQAMGLATTADVGSAPRLESASNEDSRVTLERVKKSFLRK